MGVSLEAVTSDVAPSNNSFACHSHKMRVTIVNAVKSESAGVFQRWSFQKCQKATFSGNHIKGFMKALDVMSGHRLDTYGRVVLDHLSTFNLA